MPVWLVALDIAVVDDVVMGEVDVLMGVVTVGVIVGFIGFDDEEVAWITALVGPG